MFGDMGKKPYAEGNKLYGGEWRKLRRSLVATGHVALCIRYLYLLLPILGRNVTLSPSWHVSLFRISSGTGGYRFRSRNGYRFRSRAVIQKPSLSRVRRSSRDVSGVLGLFRPHVFQPVMNRQPRRNS